MFCEASPRARLRRGPRCLGKVFVSSSQCGVWYGGSKKKKKKKFPTPLHKKEATKKEAGDGFKVQGEVPVSHRRKGSRQDWGLEIDIPTLGPPFPALEDIVVMVADGDVVVGLAGVESALH
eukprot:gene1396-819_t